MKHLVKTRYFFKYKLQLRFWAALFVFGLIFYFAMVQGGFISWFLFYAFLPVIIYLSLLVLYPPKWLTAVRNGPGGALFSGDPIQISINLNRKAFLPFFMVGVRDQTETDAENDASAVYPLQLLWAGRHATFTGRMPSVRRGIYSFSSVQVVLGDPFGFFQKQFILPCRSSLTVYPRIRTLGDFGALNGSDRASLSGDADLFEFSGLRDYQPNDRLSWMDWKASARRNAPVARQFESETDHHAEIILSARKDDPPAIFERAVSFTASIVIALLNKGTAVQLTVDGDPAMKLNLKTSGKKERSEVLDQLAGLKQSERRVRKGAADDCTSVIVTMVQNFTGRSGHGKRFCFCFTGPGQTDTPVSAIPSDTVLFRVPGDEFTTVQKVSH